MIPAMRALLRRGRGYSGVGASGERPPPLFHSDWSSTLGTSTNAMRDTSKALPWDLVVGSFSTPNTSGVVASTGLDFPSANVFQINGDNTGADQFINTRQVAILPENSRWPIPAIGESLYFRLYKRLVYPVPTYPALGNGNHPIEERAGGSSNWSWSFDVDASGWRPKLQSQVSTRYYLTSGGSPVYLARNATYRLEWQVKRTGAAALELHARIYNSANALLYGDADFMNGATSLADLPVCGVTDLNGLDGLQVGTNGPTTTDPGGSIIPMWYLGCVAVRADDWCGPYSGGI